MSLMKHAPKGVLAVAAVGALALGGSALASGASSGGSTTSTQPSAPPAGMQQPPSGAPQRPDPTTPGGHVGANGKTEQALPSGVAAKVQAAAEAKIPTGTVLRVETDVDHGSPYEAHVQKADGSQVEVLVNDSFTVTAVNTMPQHP